MADTQLRRPVRFRRLRASCAPLRVEIITDIPDKRLKHKAAWKRRGIVAPRQKTEFFFYIYSDSPGFCDW